jgi:carboxymethylenebutenolidase
MKVLATFTTLTAAATLNAETVDVDQHRGSFTSSGKSIGVEEFIPKSRGPSPAIVVLHGAGGMDYGNSYVRQLATALAGNGYATFLVHYFDRTGTSYAGDETIHKHFETWLKSIGDAVSHVAQRPGVDARKIAMFGYSLGAYLAIAHAASDPRIKAVVELAGGIDASYARHVERMPPTLIVHGDADRRVPVERAHELEQLLRKTTTPFEIPIYPEEGHLFSPKYALQTLILGLAFLEKQMP